MVFVFICILMGLAEPGNPYKTIPSFILPFIFTALKSSLWKLGFKIIGF